MALAIKPADNEAFYREVDEELRREQMTSFWKRYGVMVIAGVVLLLVAIAGVIYWQHRQDLKAAEKGAALTQVIADIQVGQTKEAAAKLDAIAADAGPGYRAAALLTKADIAIQSGDDAAAVGLFKQVAADDDLPEAYRELALIRQTTVEFDTLAPAAVIERLAPMAKPGHPWFGSAGEMVALAHLKQNQPTKAGPIFAAMAKDEGVPESIRSRARQMASALGIDAGQSDEGAQTPAATKEEAE